MGVIRSKSLRRAVTSALRLRCLLALLVVPVSPVFAQLYSIERDVAALVQLNPSDGSTIDNVDISLAGELIEGGNGLAAQPGTFVLYGLLRLDGQTGRELVSINPATGVATSVGDTGLELEGLAFDASGTLYGVTDRSDPTQETLFTLSLADGSATSFHTLDSADIAEAIAYHSGDGRMYRTTEQGKGSPILYQSIELSNPFTTTDISLTGDVFGTPSAMTYAGGGNFLLSDEAGGFFELSDSGVATLLGNLEPLRGEGPPEEGGLSKGLAFVPEPVTIWLLGLGLVVSTRPSRRGRHLRAA